MRKAVNGVLGQPANEKRGGALPSRRYFDSERHLKRHLRQYGGVGYLWRGENRHGHGLLEINNDGFGQTWPNERVSREVEALYFAQIAAEQQAWLRAQGYGR